jgi:hypothetical protein
MGGKPSLPSDMRFSAITSCCWWSSGMPQTLLLLLPLQRFLKSSQALLFTL